MKEAGSLEKADICLCIARRIRRLNAGFHGFSVGPFQRKKGLLHCQSAAVAGKASVCTDDAVAGDGDKNSVPASMPRGWVRWFVFRFVACIIYISFFG